MYAWESINISDLLSRIQKSFREDVGKGDITSKAVFSASHVSSAKLIAKDFGVIAGMELAALVLHYADKNIKFKKMVKEGDSVKPGQCLALITGRTLSVLAAERILLNLLQHVSGIATLTRNFTEAVKGTNVKILDTRKTTPLWRDVEKYAVRVGGGLNHRMGLYDAILIKDNHIAAAGSITKAVLKAKKFRSGMIEVESKTLEEVKECYHANVNRIMFDNMTLRQMSAAVRWLKRQAKPIPETEASGGVTLKTVKQIAKTGVDYISVGALTHSPGILDISLLI